MNHSINVSPGNIPSTEVRVIKKRRPSLRLALFLFLATGLTTLFAGYSLYATYLYQGGVIQALPSWSGLLQHPGLLVHGLPFSAALMLILLAHESGHYFACRHYHIDCTLPYLIPAPPFINMFGTFGALIRIKSHFLNRRQLFDVGIAGPLAGFVMTIPVLLAGLAMSGPTVVTESDPGSTLIFGEPLLFKAASRIFFSGAGESINLHPLGWAAWLGMLATSLNLLPAGQLDGGHITYALSNAGTHRRISWATAVFLLAMGLWSWPVLAYLLFGILLLVMKLAHPPTMFDGIPLDRKRIILAFVAGAIFLLTFIPVPVQIGGP